jgi:hypothetical protein
MNFSLSPLVMHAIFRAVRDFCARAIVVYDPCLGTTAKAVLFSPLLGRVVQCDVGFGSGVIQDSLDGSVFDSINEDLVVTGIISPFDS